MKRNFTLISAFIIAAVSYSLLGFSVKDNGSYRFSEIQRVPVSLSGISSAAFKYTDSLNGSNDTTSLKNRGYKVYYRGAGSQGIAATWFQGDAGVFSSFNGPAAGYVAANYNAASGNNNIDNWLVLPALNINSGDTLSFYSRSDPYSPPRVDSITVSYSAAGDSVPEAGSWVSLGTFQVPVGVWTIKNFPAPAGGVKARFAIRYKVANGGPSGPNSNYIGIDMITVSGQSSSSGSTLVLIHDTTLASVSRKADRDSLYKYLGAYVGSYTLATYNSSSTLPALSSYSLIVIQETANDGITLGATARSNLISWLNSGSSGNRKKLLCIGADFGYNYSRVGSASRDTTFAHNMGGYIYKVDVASAPPYQLTGVGIDVGNVRSMTNAPPGGNWWPAGVTPYNGAGITYRHNNHGAADTVAGVYRSTQNYVFVTAFQDPRYFINNSFNPVLQALMTIINGPTGIENQGNIIASSYALYQNYPNPFNPVTVISYSIPKSGTVTLKVYDIMGREVKTLISEMKSAGNYKIEFDGSALPSGAYFYKLQAGDFTGVKKMVLMK